MIVFVLQILFNLKKLVKFFFLIFNKKLYYQNLSAKDDQFVVRPRFNKWKFYQKTCGTDKG